MEDKTNIPGSSNQPVEGQTSQPPNITTPPAQETQTPSPSENMNIPQAPVQPQPQVSPPTGQQPVQETQEPQLSQPPVPIKTKVNLRKIGLFVLLGLLVVSIPIAIYYYSSSDRKDTEEKNKMLASSPTTTPSPTTTLSPTVSILETMPEATNTKSYDGKRVSFEYPEDWKLDTKSGILIQIGDEEDFYGVEFAYVDFTDYNRSLESAKVRNPSLSPDFTRVDGKRAFRYLDEIKGEGVGGFYDTVDVEQPVGLYLISAIAVKKENIPKYKPIFNQILASVKFKKFDNGGCGGIDTAGELVCECDGQLLKHFPPIGGLGPIDNIGAHTCKGQCGSCCYKGTAEQDQFPICQN